MPTEMVYVYEYNVEDEHGLHVAGPFQSRIEAERLIERRDMRESWEVTQELVDAFIKS